MTQWVSGQLREQVLSGALPAGAPLREEDLAAEFGVSRHVVREALRLLAADGLADYASYRGARVPRLSGEDVRDIYRARTFIETAALLRGDGDLARELALIHGRFVRAVSEKAWVEAFASDVAFHGALAAAAGSDRLTAWHSDLMRSLRLAHLVAPAFQEQGLSESVAQHAEIIVALTAGDQAGAARALEDHLGTAQKLLALRVDDAAPPGRRTRPPMVGAPKD
ncbi:GntR family transcriptional regulator [Phenylobacterium sp.]|uniref:GntR family transcriptional regulator n=1 Tax=Phenylobacterium sp. TaxID=1871053 RepID=UPI0037CA3104